MYSTQASIWKPTAMVLCDKHKIVLLDTLSKTTKHLNPLNCEFNPICHLLALLRAHYILPLSRIRVKNVMFCKELQKKTVYCYILNCQVQLMAFMNFLPQPPRPCNLHLYSTMQFIVVRGSCSVTTAKTITGINVNIIEYQQQTCTRK